MNKLGTKLGAIAMSAVMALSFAPSAAITSLAASGDGLLDATLGVEAVHSVYNPNTGEHLFTTSDGEVDYLVNTVTGWKDEGVKWKTPSVSSVPVYRVYNPNNGDHHYTTDLEERAFNLKNGWVNDNEGKPVFYGTDSADPDAIPVYRLFNPNEATGTHHYTTDLGEYVWAVGLGWNGEGSKFYGYPSDYEPEKEELTVSINNTTPKVGDTLTAIVEGAAAASYEWSINGVVYATSESITVPASAAYGDRISVTVTAEDGETATDMVFVGGFTIVEVEPTTDTATTYKYIRATFSAALSSLEPSEIEIRRKSDKQLYSVESVNLSTNGKVADITLFGDTGVAGTQFLEAATIYVMTVTHDGFSDDLEFQLPDNRRDIVVTSVGVEEGTITTVDDGRNTTRRTLGNGGQFTVGDEYLGNLGYLVGRNVIVGLNADNELMNFDVEDQNVVIAKVKYVEKDANNDDKNYFETPDEKKYYLVDTASATTTVAATQLYDAADGTQLGTPADKAEFQYAKLVLNKNGRVATAVLQGATAWDGHIIATSFDGTQVIESADFALDFDGYTIVKDDEYVEVSDLEEGDILYYNTADKFVDVYTESVTGNIDKITSEKITIDGTAYKWAGAQYLKNKKYATLAGTTDTVEADLKYLYSLDEDEDTTIVLNRAGTIQVIDGVVKDEVTTTSSIYVLTEDAAAYEIGTSDYLELKGSDGTQETLVINLSNLKKYDNNDVKTAVYTSATSVTINGAAVTLGTGSALGAGTPVKVTKNAEGDVIELDTRETIAKPGSATLSDGATAQTIDADSTSLYATTTDTIAFKATTPVYIVNDKADDDGNPPFKVEKTTVGELTKTANGANVAAWAKSTSASAEFLIIDNTNANAWTTSDKEKIGGLVTGVTKGLNTASGKEEVETISLYTSTGAVDLDADELGYTATPSKGDYITFSVKKGTYTLAEAPSTTDEFVQLKLDASRAYSDSKLADMDGITTVTRATNSKVYVYDAAADSYTETTIGAVNTTKKAATLEYHVVESNTNTGKTVATSDMMVVTYGATTISGKLTLTASAFTTDLAQYDVIGNDTTAYTPAEVASGVSYELQYWNTATHAWTDTGATVAYNAGELSVTDVAGVDIKAATAYRLQNTTAGHTNDISDTLKTVAQAATTLGSAVDTPVTAGAVTISKAAATTPVALTTAVLVLDQFGDAMTTANTTGTKLTITLGGTAQTTHTAVLTWTGGGVPSMALSAADTTATMNGGTATFGGCTVTITVS